MSRANYTGLARGKSSEAPRSVLLIVVAGIGDFVMATQAIRAVRNGHPNARIDLLTSSEAAAIACRHPGVDRVFAFPIRELRRSRFPIRSIIDVLRRLRRTRYDIVVNLYPVCSWVGSLRMLLLLMFLRAQAKASQAAGWLRYGLDTPLPKNMFAGKHIVDAMTSVACMIGGRADDLGLELPVDSSAMRTWADLVGPVGSGGGNKLIGINPGGDRSNRRWPGAKFAAAARVLMDLTGARILIFGGPGEEAIAAAIQEALNGTAVNLAGRLSLRQLPYFISRCDLLITNDSGPMHIAAALDVPVVAVFGPEDAGAFQPYAVPDRCRVIQKPVDCRPCKQVNCSRPICLDTISPSDVVAAGLHLLRVSPPVRVASRSTGMV